MSRLGFIRTALFVPGNHPERVDKAVLSAADLVIIDLEDAVPLAEKTSTRPLVRAKIEQHSDRLLMVRVNALDTGLTWADLDQILVAGLDAIMLPKVQRPEDLDRIHVMLAEMEPTRGFQAGSVAVVPLIESALAVENAFQIASLVTSPPRLYTLAFGAADYCLDMGIRMSRTGLELVYPRGRIAVACRAAGLDAPLDTPFMMDLKDQQALEADALQGKILGFGGKLCIHPNQLDICNRIFSPSEPEVAFASRVISSFEAAEGRGRGAIVVDGKFVDYAIVAQSRRILEIAARLGIQPKNA